MIYCIFQHPVKRFLGTCDQIDIELQKCMIEEVITSQGT